MRVLARRPRKTPILQCTTFFNPSDSFDRAYCPSVDLVCANTPPLPNSCALRPASCLFTMFAISVLGVKRVPERCATHLCILKTRVPVIFLFRPLYLG